jgi:hypothetical protein
VNSPNVRPVGGTIFPHFQGRYCNMMPFVMGNHASLPEDYQPYLAMIRQCEAEVPEERGRVGYLTIDERITSGGSHRRAGVHTEASLNGGWGGGSWGGQRGGLFMASSVGGSTRIYDTAVVPSSDSSVRPELLRGVSRFDQPVSFLHWIHDRTPHESLPLPPGTQRQFFRLVTSEVDLWFANHSTANPLGVQPAARVIEGSKFSG